MKCSHGERSPTHWSYSLTFVAIIPSSAIEVEVSRIPSCVEDVTERKLILRHSIEDVFANNCPFFN
jgi:hypothetical protein